MPLRTKKNFWIEKINALLTHKGVDPANLVEGVDWEDKLKTKLTWQQIQTYAAGICQDIYAKATINVSPFPANNINGLLNELIVSADGRTAANEYWNNVWNTTYAYQDLAEVLRTKIGVDPEDTTLVTDANGNNVPKWKHDINQRLSGQTKLTDIPHNLELADLLYRNDLYRQIVNNATGLPDLLERNLTGNDRPFVYGYRWTIKAHTGNLNTYKNAKNQVLNVRNDLRTIFGLTPADAVPTDWNTQLVKKALLDDYQVGFRQILEMGPTDPLPTDLQNLATLYNGKSGTQTVPQLKTKADHYDRIHTKLNGKISDNELDTLLSNSPQCSHTDYDTIKQERDQLKTEQDNHKCDCDSKVAQKETEIITKIITDLELATEKTTENLLAAVIAEIKGKLTPPVDNSKSKDNKIKELESQITNLQSPKSLNDLPISSAVKEEIIKISQELGCTSQACAKLETANSYQELSSLQKEAFQEKLNNEVSSRKSAEYLNYGLGALCIGSLVALAYLLIRQTKDWKINSEKKQE